MEFVFISPALWSVGNYSQVKSINRQWIIKLYCSIIVIPPLLSWGYKNILDLRFPNIFASEKYLHEDSHETSCSFWLRVHSLKQIQSFWCVLTNYPTIFVEGSRLSSINLSVYCGLWVCAVRRKVFQLTKHLAPSAFSCDKNKSKQDSDRKHRGNSSSPAGWAAVFITPDLLLNVELLVHLGGTYYV